MGSGETRYYDMDVSELTKVIISRVQKFEPENAMKITGCLLINEPSEQELIQLAFGPNNAFQSKISETKSMLSIHHKDNATAPVQSDVPHQFSAVSTAGPRSFSSSPAFVYPAHAQFWDTQLPSDQQPSVHNVDYMPRIFTDSVGEEYLVRNQSQFLASEEQLESNNMGSNFSSSYYYQDAPLGASLSSRASRRSPSLPELSIKACHYFYRGYCKHGSNCRYYHGPSLCDGYPQLFGKSISEISNEEHGFVPGSLEKLEMEITELLKAKRGQPVTIAALPMLYFEKYGRNLQAEGYLTESQRHGKAGFSLTKLLARLKNSIRLIDRPHGQHCVILAEEAPRFAECRNDRSDASAIVASSHQIYLTFPAESTFNEDDVANYFKQYGPVRDVRIPCQDKRMFGFVSFIYADTVSLILAKRNPHFICGARVLVKPYREKSRIIDRTNYMERVKPSMYYPQYLEMDPDFHSVPRECETSRLLKKQFLEDQERMVELERRRLAEFGIVPKPLGQPYFGFNMDEFKVPEGSNEFPLTDHFSYTLDALNNGSTSDDKARHANHNDPESSPVELPESPFATAPVVGSISAVM